GLLSEGPREEDGAEQARSLTCVHVLVLAFGAWVTLTYLTAQNRDAAYNVFIEYVKIFVMFIVATVLIRNVRQVWILFLLTALSLGYIAYEINFLYLAYHYLGIWKNGYGGFDNNGAGLMLAMGVPLCYFAWEGTQGHPRRSMRWFRWVFLALV